MDELLFQRFPRLSGVMVDYDRVLKQRNSLLKSARASGIRGTQLSTLEIWDDRLVEFGSEIIQTRSALIAEMLPEVSAAYAAIAGAEHRASLASYLSILSNDSSDEATIEQSAVRGGALDLDDVKKNFRAALARLRRGEVERGITLAGPHRDDLVLELNDLPARGYASHGESWSFALALKLASAEVLRRESTTGDPVLILDDVFAELDESRRARLASAVDGFEQVLITAAVLDDVPEALAGHIVRIRAGRIIEEGEA
jgi:DNA replication and repair protein RecF